jgi:hypothetical protein
MSEDLVYPGFADEIPEAHYLVPEDHPLVARWLDDIST